MFSLTAVNWSDGIYIYSF